MFGSDISKSSLLAFRIQDEPWVFASSNQPPPGIEWARFLATPLYWVVRGPKIFYNMVCMVDLGPHAGHPVFNLFQQFAERNTRQKDRNFSATWKLSMRMLPG
jgi:hypothetical protein